MNPMLLVTEWFGVFLVDDGAVVAKSRFPTEPRPLAEVLLRLDRGEVLAAEEDLAPSEPFEVVERRLLRLEGASLTDAALDLTKEAPKLGYEARHLHDAACELARMKLREALSEPDRHVVQAVDALDDLDAGANALTERLREWMALHYPELADAAASPEEYAALVSKHGDREAIAAARPDLAAPESVGGPLGEDERDVVRQVARAVSNLYQARAQVDRYLDERVPELAPNVSQLVTAPIAARLIRLAGGLDRLARLPAGTIQTLGAEKALFRHIREGAKPPKHGVLFQHPLVYKAPPRQRGNVARALAGKVALAARADALTGDDIADELEAQVQARVREIRRQHGKGSRGGGRRRGGGGRRRGGGAR